MALGSTTPNPRSDPPESSELNAARGTLREALSGLRNFAELMHSLRVGSKALISVLPDVAAGCAPMREAIGVLLSAVERRGQAEAACLALRDYFTPRLALLDRELAAADEKPLAAKSRLALEQVITRLSLELDTARSLLDLLVDAVSDQPLRVELWELLQQSFAGPPSGGSWKREHIAGSLSFAATDAEVELNPRTATALLALGVELVAQGGKDPPHVLVDRDDQGRYRVSIQRCKERQGEELQLIARGVIEPTLLCVQAVARISGVSLSWHQDSASVSLTFPERAPAPARKPDDPS